MINLELPQKLLTAQQMAHQLAKGAFRPIARKYDRIEHCPTPEELIPISQMMKAMGGQAGMGGKGESKSDGVKNGANLMGIMATTAMRLGMRASEMTGRYRTSVHGVGMWVLMPAT